MSDAADVSCVHLVSGLERDNNVLQWQCLDCGRVFAAIAFDAPFNLARLELWAHRAGIPPRTLARSIARYGPATPDGGQ